MLRAALLSLLLLAAPDEWSEFRVLSRDRDPERRCEAVEKIRPRADLPMVQALLPLFADPHPRVRKRAAEAVARAAHPDCADFLRRAGLKHPQKTVRILAAECLGAISGPDGAASLASALGDFEPEVRAAAAGALAAMEAKDAVERLVTVAKRDPAWQPRAAALEALATLDPALAAPQIAEAAKDRAYQVRLMASLVAPKLDREAGVAAVTAGLADSDWRVRVQAIESACEVRERPHIGLMIDLLAKEKGRLRWDLYLALRDLTGKDLGLDAKIWNRWWDVNRETFVVPPKGATGEAASPGGETGVQFFTLPILSTRMSFVLDLSGSMRDPAPPVPGKPAESKLDLAKREMGRTIAQLPEAVWFNLLLLGCDGDGRYEKGRMSWKKTLQPATPRGRAEAASFLNRQEGKGWTNIWDGIELAFEDELVDTIYLYTDGGASRGVYVATDDIFDELRKMNRFRKIMVHTVEVPAEKPNTPDNIRLLKGLADQTKGLYRLTK